MRSEPPVGRGCVIVTPDCRVRRFVGTKTSPSGDAGQRRDVFRRRDIETDGWEIGGARRARVRRSGLQLPDETRVRRRAASIAAGYEIRIVSVFWATAP
jgi:hypothetical protein